jgi:hypothetical protein
LPASGLGTIALTVLGSRIGKEKLGATAAFASALLVAHDEPHRQSDGREENQKEEPEENENPKKEEEL